MTPSRPATRPTAVIGLALLTGGLWLGVGGAVVPTASADPGDNASSHSRPDHSPRRQAADRAPSSRGGDGSQGDRGAARVVGERPSATTAGTGDAVRESNTGPDRVRPNRRGVSGSTHAGATRPSFDRRIGDGLRRSAKGGSAAGVDGAGGGADGGGGRGSVGVRGGLDGGGSLGSVGDGVDGAGGGANLGRHADKVRPESPAPSAEEFKAQSITEHPPASSGVETTDSGVETAGLRIPAGVLKLPAPQDLIAQIPVTLPGSGVPEETIEPGSFTEQAEARGRELLVALTARVPGDRTQRATVASVSSEPAGSETENGETVTGQATPVETLAIVTTDATAKPEPASLAGNNAVPTTAALAQLTSQLRTLVTDTSDAAHVFATTVRATAIGVATSLSQGVDTLRDAELAGPVNVVGSVVFSLLGAVLQIFSGPPVLPAGSNVTVRTSTLVLPDSGKTVRADWYFPDEVGENTRLIYLQHGFMATGPMYSYTAAYLAETTNSIVVAPSMSSNAFDPQASWLGGDALQQDVADLFRGDRPELAASAAEAGYTGELPKEFVLVGHSAGATLVMGAAEKMDDESVADLKGVVLLDGVDLDNAVPDGLARINDVPVLDISSERYIWNLYGLVGDELQAARPDSFNGVVLKGGRHIDALQGGNFILQFAEYVVAGFSQPDNIDAVKVLASSWINDMYDGVTPEYDPNGPATAIPLSDASDKTVMGMPWDPIAEVILTALMKQAFYQPVSSGGSPAASQLAVLR